MQIINAKILRVTYYNPDALRKGALGTLASTRPKARRLAAGQIRPLPTSPNRSEARGARYGSKGARRHRGAVVGFRTEAPTRGMIRPLSHSPHRPISRGAAPDAIEFPTAGLAAARNRVKLPLRIEASTTVPTRHCDKPPQHCFHLDPERTHHSSSDGSAHVGRVLRYRGRQPIARLCRTRPRPHEWKL
jgi:hypothetical protein